jgi:hypothetical protein
VPLPLSLRGAIDHGDHLIVTAIDQFNDRQDVGSGVPGVDTLSG